jgi:molybdopterin-guanine dinucleotide biosynthesis protein A
MKTERKNFLTTLILCGGKSSRMAQDKALLEFQGIPLLKKMVGLGLGCSSQVGIITPHPQHYSSILPEGCNFILEPTPVKGPLYAFALGLAQVNSDWVLLLAVDLPLLTEETLTQWLLILTQQPREVLALVPFADGFWHPLCAFYHRDCLTSLQTFLAGGGTSFQKWLTAPWVQVLAVEDTRVLTNCNTPQEWQRLGGEDRI